MLCRHHAAWHMAQVLQCVLLSLWLQWSALGAVAQCVALLSWVASVMPWLLRKDTANAACSE